MDFVMGIERIAENLVFGYEIQLCFTKFFTLLQ
jgi:hypothetical protein